MKSHLNSTEEFMKNYLLLLPLLSFIGCAALGIKDLPGTIRENVSEFDKSTEILMEPAWLMDGGSPSFKLGLFRTSKMDLDKVILTVVVNGIHNFSSKDSLSFNMDGKIESFDSIDTTTKVEYEPGEYNSVASISGTHWSSKRYEVSKDFISALITGKKVWAKVSLEQSYMEGEFSTDSFTCARPAFKKFYNKVWPVK